MLAAVLSNLRLILSSITLSVQLHSPSLHSPADATSCLSTRSRAWDDGSILQTLTPVIKECCTISSVISGGRRGRSSPLFPFSDQVAPFSNYDDFFTLIWGIRDPPYSVMSHKLILSARYTRAPSQVRTVSHERFL